MATSLSINNYFYRRGGAETVFFEQNRLLEQIGWTVVPFAMRHSMNIDTEYSKYFVDEIEFGADYSAWEKLVRIPKVIYSVEARRKLNRLLNDVDARHLPYPQYLSSHLPVYPWRAQTAWSARCVDFT